MYKKFISIHLCLPKPCPGRPSITRKLLLTFPTLYLIEGAGSFLRRPIIAAEQMIVIEIGIEKLPWTNS